MPEYLVGSNGSAYLSMKINADTPEDAVDVFYMKAPGSICAQCSGWDKGYLIEVPSEWEVSDVIDTEDRDFTNLWSDPQQDFIDGLREEIKQLRAENEDLRKKI